MVLVLGFAVVTLAISGLAIDGTRAFLFRRTLQHGADSAALAAADQLDSSIYYGSRGRRVVVDVPAARRVAMEWLTRRRLPARAAIRVQPRAVAVILRGAIDATFLRLVGIRQIPVAVEAVAAPVPGR